MLTQMLTDDCWTTGLEALKERYKKKIIKKGKWMKHSIKCLLLKINWKKLNYNNNESRNKQFMYYPKYSFSGLLDLFR